MPYRSSRRRVLQGLALAASGMGPLAMAACTGSSRRNNGSIGRATPSATNGTGTKVPPPTPATEGGAEAAGKPGGTLVIAATGYPSDLDPVALNAALTDAFVSLVYNGLLAVRNGSAAYPEPGDATVAPDLAASMPEQPDELTYIFRLRQDVRWQKAAPLNGRPFTAEDAAWHYRRAIGDPRSALKAAFAPIGAADAPDTTTLKLTLKEAHAPFLTTIAGGFQRFILPREVGDAGRLGAQLTGTGPFALESSEPDRRAVFKRNPAYFKRDAAGSALPYVAEIDWLVLPDPGARLQAYQSRQANLTALLTPIEAGELRTSNPNDFSFGETPGVSNELFMPVDRAPFDDVRVRRALALALDRDDLLKKLATGRGEVDLPIPVFLRSVSPQAGTLGSAGMYLKRDLQMAKQLLSAAGFAAGLETTLSFTAQYGSMFVQAAQLVQGYLREAGVSVTARQLDYPTYLRTVFRGDFQGLAYAPRNIFPDPDNYLSDVYLPGGPVNQTHANDAQLLDLIRRQRGSVSAKERTAALTELQRYLTDNQFRITDVAIDRTYGWQKAVRNYRATLWPSYANLEAAWLMP